VTVILCLGAGIAVNVTVLSLINSLFYGDIPGVHERRALARVLMSYDEGAPIDALSIEDFHEQRRATAA